VRALLETPLGSAHHLSPVVLVLFGIRQLSGGGLDIARLRSRAPRVTPTR
jgi:hypothetical protein